MKILAPRIPFSINQTWKLARFRIVIGLIIIMVLPCLIIQRGISTSCINYGKRNFRKFLLLNKRGGREFKEKQRTDPYPLYPIDKRGVRDTGLFVKKKFIPIPEMIPEIIVPSLEGFNLKPYVSYKTEVSQEEFTAKDLFDEIYAEKIKEDFKKDDLCPNGDPKNPSEYEKLTPEEAFNRARKTGCDIFSDNTPSSYVRE
ncbi:hypothetical protein M0802_005102 [Mischocyttarus mexicanus]|nr:hypothetical protein M0802_005102 [Mischocyttarus mexicanus]